MRGVSSGVAADLQSGGFAELAGRAATARDLGNRFRLDGPWSGKVPMAKLLSVISTVLAITAGPVLASLLEHPPLSHAQHDNSFQLRGSIAFNAFYDDLGDLKLRGSIR